MSLVLSQLVFTNRMRAIESPRPDHSGKGNLDYSSTDSTSATNLAASSPRYEATTLNMASLKPAYLRSESTPVFQSIRHHVNAIP